MTNEIFEPVGLLEITKQLKTSRNKLDDLTERMQTALDAKRDAASAMSDELQEVMKRNQAMWQSGYDEGFKAGRDSEMKQHIDSMTLDEVSQELVSGGISVEDQDQLVDDVAKMIEDKDEDEPDQYQPEPEKWGGTK
jgi:signal recognition particle GTPase